MPESIRSWLRRPSAPALTCAVLALALLAPVLARDVVPTPSGGGPGINLLPADQEKPLGLPAPVRSEPGFARDPDGSPLPAGARLDDLGGDDVEIVTVPAGYRDDLAVTSDGDLLSIVMWDDGDGAYRFVVRRSHDHGTTWRDWATFYDSTPHYRYCDPVIHVAEGDVDRVFVAYTLDSADYRPTEVHVAWSPLNLEYGDFSNDIVLHTEPHGVNSVDFTTDADQFSDYFCYLVFSADDGDGSDIHFVRSTDQGTSWESSYVIGAIAVDDRGYYRPCISVGYGGVVHVVWFLGFATDHEYDDTIRYRRAGGYAGGGLGSWDNMRSLTSHLNDVDEFMCAIDASPVSAGVMMAWMRRLRNPDGTTSYDGIGTLASIDQGTNWGGLAQFGGGVDHLGDVLYQEVNDRWLVGLYDSGEWGIRWAPATSPAAWSDLLAFNDQIESSGAPALVINPRHSHRIGIAGGRGNDDGSYSFVFDGEWRTDPGYPNLEDGFPVDLTFEPRSDPAIVDLDGDGDLEILFADTGGQIHAFRHDGTPLPGWPVNTGESLSESPIAIGDLNGDGRLAVVAGTMTGLVLGYDADGALLDGWPCDVHINAPTYVAIGSLGGPYPRAVLAGAGSLLVVRDWRGEPYPDASARMVLGRIIDTPPAVGDVDGDGRNEIVFAASQTVYAYPRTGSVIFTTDLEADASGAVTLADFDLDGDVEVVVPLENGVLHLLDGDGSEFPGAWPVTVDASPLNGTAIASFLNTAEPEIAVSAEDWLVSVLGYDGSVRPNWPTDTDGWRVFGKPIIGHVEGVTSDVMVGARGTKGWAWNGGSAAVPGWPKTFADNIYLTPAYGDIDLDGSAEVVFVTNHQLVVVDVGSAPTAASATWGMAGHDPERSGCADCAVDVVAVEDAVGGVTRVSMAAPWPNPIAGQATFSYAVPVRSRVELVIYDVRGRRVAVVHRTEEAAGQHVIGWNGRDGDGRPVASGQYVAALRVTGPGVDETVSRKVTVLR